MSNASATIHTDEGLDAEKRAALVQNLNEHPGVHACSSYDKSPHILVVEFDASVVTGHELVEFAKSAGVNAHMVG